MHGADIGNRTILDGDQGFWVMSGSDRCDFAEMTSGLGHDYRLLDVGFKPYGCCRWVHTILDVLRAATAEHRLRGDNIAQVQIETFSELIDDFFGPWPESIVEAQFHIPYLVALELAGRSSANGLSDVDLRDASLRRHGARVSGTLLAGADEKFFKDSLLPVRLTLRLDDGRSLTARAEIPSGAPGGPPFERPQVLQKFTGLAAPVLGDKRAERLRDAILTLGDA